MSNYALPGYDNWLTTNRAEDEWQFWVESDYATLAHAESESGLSFDAWLDTDEAFVAYEKARYEDFEDQMEDYDEFEDRMRDERDYEPVKGFDY